jgi:hypothetical protein
MSAYPGVFLLLKHGVVLQLYYPEVCFVKKLHRHLLKARHRHSFSDLQITDLHSSVKVN